MVPMNDTDERIRTAFARNAKAVTLRPAIGQKTAVTKARLTDGLRCEIEDGRWKLVSDSSEKSGGTGAGPDPGMIGRAALASCLAIGYRTWAAHLGVPVSGVEVEVQADFDARGQYGAEGIPAGYSEIRCVVRIESEASEADVARVIEAADDASMYWDVFARPQKLVRQVTVTKPADKGGG